MTNYLLNNITHIENGVYLSDFEWNVRNSLIYEDNLNNLFHRIQMILQEGRNAFDPYLLDQLNSLDTNSFNFRDLLGPKGSIRKYRFRCIIESPVGIGAINIVLEFVLTSLDFNQLEIFRNIGIHIPPYFALLFNGCLLDFWLPNPGFTPNPNSGNYLIQFFEQAAIIDAPALLDLITNTNISQYLWDHFSDSGSSDGTLVESDGGSTLVDPSSPLQNLLTWDEGYSSDESGLVSDNSGLDPVLSDGGYSSDESTFGPGGGSGNLLTWRGGPNH